MTLVSASPLRGGGGRDGKVPGKPRRRQGCSELLLTRSQPGIGVSVTDRAASISSVLLALLGPVAARVKAAPVFPHFTCLAGGDDAPSQLQQQLFGGGAGERVGGGVG